MVGIQVHRLFMPSLRRGLFIYPGGREELTIIRGEPALTNRTLTYLDMLHHILDREDSEGKTYHNNMMTQSKLSVKSNIRDFRDFGSESKTP